MVDGGSLVNIVRDHFSYIAKDASKNSQQKLVEILCAAVRFTNQATKTDDKEALKYLLDQTYIKDLGLLQTQDIADSSRQEQHAEKDAGLEARVEGQDLAPQKDIPKVDLSFFAKYDIDKDKDYGIADAVELLFPEGRDSELGKKYYHNAYYLIRNNSDDFKDIVIAVKKIERVRKYIKGFNIPLLWKTILSKRTSWKNEFPEELVNDVINYGSKVIVKEEPVPKNIGDKVQVPVRNFLNKFELSSDGEYCLKDVLGVLFPGGEDSALYKDRFQQFYQSVAFSVLFKALVNDGKDEWSHMVRASNIHSLLQIIIERGISWQSQISVDLINEIMNYRLSSEEGAKPGEVVVDAEELQVESLDQIVEEISSSEDSQSNLLSQLYDLMYFDDELDGLLKSATSSNKVKDVHGAVSWSNMAVTYLEGLKGSIDEIGRILRITYSKSVITLYYKDFDNKKALETINASIDLLKTLDKDTLENPAVLYFLARQYFTRSNISYKLDLDQHQDIVDAEKILWSLFKDNKLSIAPEFETLHYCLVRISTSKHPDWDERIKIAEKRKQIYSYMIEREIKSNILNLPEEIELINVFLSGRNINLYKKFKDLVLEDSTVDSLMTKGMRARRFNDRQECINNFEGAVNYLRGLEGRVDEVKRQLRLGLVYEELGMFYKEGGIIRDAIRFKELAVQSLEFVASNVPNPLDFQKDIANDCLTIANLKYKLNQDDTEELKKAQKYLWIFFEKGMLNGNQDYFSLNRALFFLGKRLKGDELVENLNQQIQFYQHLKSKRITIPHFHGTIDDEIEKVQKKLARVESTI